MVSESRIGGESHLQNTFMLLCYTNVYNINVINKLIIYSFGFMLRNLMLSTYLHNLIIRILIIAFYSNLY